MQAITDEVLKFISLFNERSDITIECAIMKPTANGKQYSLNLLYSPKLNYLSSLYFQDTSQVTSTKFSFLYEIVSAFPSKRAEAPKEDPLGREALMPTVFAEGSLITNLSALYADNFSLFNTFLLPLFLHEDSIVYCSDNFREFILNNKESFKPTFISFINKVGIKLEELYKKSCDYNAYSSSNKVTLNLMLSELQDVIKLYFIALAYKETPYLASCRHSIPEHVIETLATAYKPWDFVSACTNTIINIKKENQAMDFSTTADLFAGTEQKKALRKLCVDLVNNAISEEIKHA